MVVRILISPVVVLLCSGVLYAQRCGWEALKGGSFVSCQINAVAVFDDGQGPHLYVGGGFRESIGNPGHNIARWDGQSWSPLGSGTGRVLALAVFDDGTGSALYVGGGFRRAGDIPDANAIARWDGIEWSRLGTGMYGVGPWGPQFSVHALTVFDDGSGRALYAGGSFEEAGGVPAINVAKWDGLSWSALGAGLPGLEVRDLAVYDDGTGAALYAAGVIGPTAFVKWDGQEWIAVGGDVGPIANALLAHDFGSGPALYTGGQLSVFGGTPISNVALWNGRDWSALGVGTSGTVWSFHTFDDGTGPGLYVGGSFFEAGGIPSWGIARWDGQWSPLGSGLWNGPTFGPIAFAMTTFDDGTGPALYVGGEFKEAGGVPANCIARWRCTPTCYPDCDGSGSLDFFDFLCFQNAFLANDPYADCDRDGQLTFFDFLCFQNEFLAGCP